jgi:hypothetical protein
MYGFQLLETISFSFTSVAGSQYLSISSLDPTALKHLNCEQLAYFLQILFLSFHHMEVLPHFDVMFFSCTENEIMVLSMGESSIFTPPISGILYDLTFFSSYVIETCIRNSRLRVNPMKKFFVMLPEIKTPRKSAFHQGCSYRPKP